MGVLTLSPQPIHAATTDTESQFVSIALIKPDIVVLIRLEEISSISSHKYLLNGTVGMIEVTIDIRGENSIRFYTEDPKNDPPVKVSKPYIAGTHSHTVVYSVNSVSDLRTIYSAVSTAMIEQEGVEIQVSPGDYWFNTN